MILWNWASFIVGNLSGFVLGIIFVMAFVAWGMTPAHKRREEYDRHTVELMRERNRLDVERNDICRLNLAVSRQIRDLHFAQAARITPPRSAPLPQTPEKE